MRNVRGLAVKRAEVLVFDWNKVIKKGLRYV